MTYVLIAFVLNKKTLVAVIGVEPNIFPQNTGYYIIKT